MFDALSERLQATLSDVRSRGSLTEEDVTKAMRQVRLALLEADVNLKVVKDFTARVKERSLGARVLESLNPGQQVVALVDEELTALMGGEGQELELGSEAPVVVVMAGLQGSGKTTACAKLARHLREERGSDVALAACDLQRPAAVEQLVTVGKRADVPVYERGADGDPVEVAAWALERAGADGRDVLVVDTSGRLHVDAELMEQLASIARRTGAERVLLVVDAMTGQDAVAVAERFAAAVDVDGIVLTKLDGDARGGAALSVKAVTGKSILFASTGERVDAFERFHPERMAQRILGMGDVLTLVERAERQMDEQSARDLERKIKREELTLDDFLEQMKQVRRMGPLQGLLSMVPGLGAGQLSGLQVDERQLDRIEAVITSMTPEERRNPEILNGSRRRRIARGSGTSVQAVNQLVKQFAQMRSLMKQLSSGRMPSLQELMGGR